MLGRCVFGDPEILVARQFFVVYPRRGVIVVHKRIRAHRGRRCQIAPLGERFGAQHHIVDPRSCFAGFFDQPQRVILLKRCRHRDGCPLARSCLIQRNGLQLGLAVVQRQTGILIRLILQRYRLARRHRRQLDRAVLVAELHRHTGRGIIRRLESDIIAHREQLRFQRRIGRDSQLGIVPHHRDFFALFAFHTVAHSHHCAVIRYTRFQRQIRAGRGGFRLLVILTGNGAVFDAVNLRVIHRLEVYHRAAGGRNCRPHQRRGRLFAGGKGLHPVGVDTRFVAGGGSNAFAAHLIGGGHPPVVGGLRLQNVFLHRVRLNGDGIAFQYHIGKLGIFRDLQTIEERAVARLPPQGEPRVHRGAVRGFGYPEGCRCAVRRSGCEHMRIARHHPIAGAVGRRQICIVHRFGLQRLFIGQLIVLVFVVLPHIDSAGIGHRDGRFFSERGIRRNMNGVTGRTIRRCPGEFGGQAGIGVFIDHLQHGEPPGNGVQQRIGEGVIHMVVRSALAKLVFRHHPPIVLFTKIQRPIHLKALAGDAGFAVDDLAEISGFRDLQIIAVRSLRRLPAKGRVSRHRQAIVRRFQREVRRNTVILFDNQHPNIAVKVHAGGNILRSVGNLLAALELQAVVFHIGDLIAINADVLPRKGVVFQQHIGGLGIGSAHQHLGFAFFGIVACHIRCIALSFDAHAAHAAVAGHQPPHILTRIGILLGIIDLQLVAQSVRPTPDSTNRLVNIRVVKIGQRGHFGAHFQHIGTLGVFLIIVIRITDGRQLGYAFGNRLLELTHLGVIAKVPGNIVQRNIVLGAIFRQPLDAAQIGVVRRRTNQLKFRRNLPHRVPRLLIHPRKMRIVDRPEFVPDIELGNRQIVVQRILRNVLDPLTPGIIVGGGTARHAVLGHPRRKIAHNRVILLNSQRLQPLHAVFHTLQTVLLVGHPILQVFLVVAVAVVPEQVLRVNIITHHTGVQRQNATVRHGFVRDQQPSGFGVHLPVGLGKIHRDRVIHSVFPLCPDRKRHARQHQHRHHPCQPSFHHTSHSFSCLPSILLNGSIEHFLAMSPLKESLSVFIQGVRMHYKHKYIIS